MNKKKDIIALALSVSFVIGGASLSHADEINPDTTSYISENNLQRMKINLQIKLKTKKMKMLQK